MQEAATAIEIIVFLGNPGNSYRLTRHNFGWLLANSLSEEAGWKQKFQGQVTELTLGEKKRILLKPSVFMNESGRSVQACARFYQAEAEEILVVHDDIELDFQQVELKRGGGLAGHNGLRSIASSLGSKDFYRLRLGVSRPAKGNVASYVLSAFSAVEKESIPAILEDAARKLVLFLGTR